MGLGKTIHLSQGNFIIYEMKGKGVQEPAGGAKNFGPITKEGNRKILYASQKRDLLFG